MHQLTEALLLILQGVYLLVKGKREILVRVTLMYPMEKPQEQQHVGPLQHC